jgi:Fe-S cluster assembly protein SufD
MMSGATNAGAWVAAYSDQHDWPEWLRNRRQAALLRFSERGFPTQRDEDWRYGNLSVLTKQLFSVPETAQIDLDWLNSLRIDAAPSLVLVNGRFSAEYSQLQNLPTGLTLCSMQHALQAFPQRVAEYWGKAVN